MKEKIKTLNKPFAAAMILAAFIALPAFAQDRKPTQLPDVHSTTAHSGAGTAVAASPGHIAANNVHVNAHPAIAFKPFDRSVDPRTGKAITPSAQIALPNGKTVTTKAYFDALDAIEKSLNAQGYSLR